MMERRASSYAYYTQLIAYFLAKIGPFYWRIQCSISNGKERCIYGNQRALQRVQHKCHFKYILNSLLVFFFAALFPSYSNLHVFCLRVYFYSSLFSSRLISPPLCPSIFLVASNYIVTFKRVRNRKTNTNSLLYAKSSAIHLFFFWTKQKIRYTKQKMQFHKIYVPGTLKSVKRSMKRRSICLRVQSMRELTRHKHT